MEATELLPLFFRLFRCPDKALRRLLFRHIIAGARPLTQAHMPARLAFFACGRRVSGVCHVLA